MTEASLFDLRQKALSSTAESRFYRVARSMQIAYEVPVPFCCPEAATTSFIQPTLEDVPGWQLCNGLTHAEIHHCPFCGTKLPGLRKKETPPAHVSSKQRGAPRYMSGLWTCPDCGPDFLCQCSPAVAAWEVDNAPPIQFVAAFISSGDADKMILSVSRKNDPEDKGLPGGKIEEGESLLDALCREVLEETGLTVIEAAPIFDSVDELGTRGVTFVVLEKTGEVQTREKGIVEWVTPEALMLRSSFKRYNSTLLHRLGYFLMFHVD